MQAIEQRVVKIYDTYLNIISPYVIQYEVLSNLFPIEILNEVRSVFAHLGKYYLSDDVLIKEKNVSKAEGHIKRAILDCYKYICVAYEDKYIEFEKMYRNTDLSFIDNGEFLPKLLSTRKNAIDLMIEARKSDLEVKSDDEINCDDAYQKYEKTFMDQIQNERTHDEVKEELGFIENSRNRTNKLKPKFPNEIDLFYAFKLTNAGEDTIKRLSKKPDCLGDEKK